MSYVQNAAVRLKFRPRSFRCIQIVVVSTIKTRKHVLVLSLAISSRQTNHLLQEGAQLGPVESSLMANRFLPDIGTMGSFSTMREKTLLRLPTTGWWAPLESAQGDFLILSISYCSSWGCWERTWSVIIIFLRSFRYALLAHFNG